MFGFISILIIGIFAFMLLVMFNTKLRAKLFGVQIKTMRNVMNNNKEDLLDIGKSLRDVLDKTGENILDKDEDKL